MFSVLSDTKVRALLPGYRNHKSARQPIFTDFSSRIQLCAGNVRIFETNRPGGEQHIEGSERKRLRQLSRMPRTASAGVRHRLCRGVTHPPQPEQLRRVRDFPARRCRCGARLRLWQIRLQRGHPPVRGSRTGGRQGGQRRTGGNHRLGASVSSRPAARVPSRKAHQGVFVLRLPRQRSPAHDSRRARHAGLPDEANARRARQEDRRTSEPHSCGLYRTDAQLLPAILQPAVPDPKDR